MALFPRVISELPGIGLIILGLFHHERAAFFPFGIDTLYMDFSSLHVVLLQKSQCVQLHVSLIAMVFHTTLLLIMEATYQQMKCVNGPMLVGFTGFTMLPAILKLLV